MKCLPITNNLLFSLKFHSHYSLLSYFSDDHLLVIGGYNDSMYSPGHGFWISYRSDVELISFNPQDEICKPLDLEYPVGHHSSVATSRGVLSCGGFKDKEKTQLNTCTLQTKEGETISFPSMKRRRSYFGMVVMDQSLILVGGWGGEDKMEKIGLNGNVWLEEGLPFAVRYHCVVSINKTMMMSIGGQAANYKVSKRYSKFVNETKKLGKRRKSITKKYPYF